MGKHSFIGAFLFAALTVLASIWLYNRFSGKRINDLGAPS